MVSQPTSTYMLLGIKPNSWEMYLGKAVRDMVKMDVLIEQQQQNPQNAYDARSQNFTEIFYYIIRRCLEHVICKSGIERVFSGVVRDVECPALATAYEP